MSKLYYYYQKVGGQEPWIPCQAETEFHEIKPTFITVLALDTLLEDTPSREVLEGIKYQGPFYLDLDAPDISDSIEAGKLLLEKLNSAGLKDVDLEIYLSGKKGLHLLVHQDAFIHKATPLVRLPAIYKEMAFKLAVDTVDFRVYTARKGRMWRTCYNIRENGNYRVPVTPDELRSLTPELYNELCKSPRSVPAPQPRFRPEFALIFDAAQQKVNSVKRRKPKPVTAQELRKVLPEVQQILKGEGLAEVGFNKIAIQLAVYAREAQWSEDTLVNYARQLIDNHASDGRYNTPNKREQHLRDMCAYVEDNPGYDYQANFLRSVIAKEVIVTSNLSDDSPVSDEEEFILSSGVFVRGGRYIVPKGEDGDTEISNFVFRDSQLLIEAAEGKIVAIRAKVGKDANIVLSPSNFTSSTSLQNVVSGYGKSFTGSDVHARGIYQIMLKEVTRTSYIVDSEGLNYIKLPAHPDAEIAGNPFLAWADRYQVVVPAWVKERDVKLEFLGFPDERGVIQTDLTLAPSIKEYLSDSDNVHDLANCIRWLMKASHPETMAKLIGWMSAAHWKPLFQAHHGKFPLLHVFGPAGLGKTELTQSLLRMFYYREDPKTTTPASTPFALLTLIGGSSSIPVMLDEWKPSRMNADIAEKYRAILRDAYNGKETQRGGGSRGKDAFNSLSKVSLDAPLVFISEACESETAILERSVVLTFRRAGAKEQGTTLAYFRRFQANLVPLSVIGKTFAASALKDDSEQHFVDNFGRMLDWAYDHFMLQPGDDEKFKEGKLTEDDMARKMANSAPRPIFNSTVALFGLVQLRNLLRDSLGELYDAELNSGFKELMNYAYAGLNVGTSMRPEYIKVLITMSDMSKTVEKGSGERILTDGIDYNLTEIAGKPVLVLATRFAYNKYRTYMRHINQLPLYPNETSFEAGIKEIPQYLKAGTGTKGLQTDTAILDLDALIAAGVPNFFGKVIALNV